MGVLLIAVILPPFQSVRAVHEQQSVAQVRSNSIATALHLFDCRGCSFRRNCLASRRRANRNRQPRAEQISSAASGPTPARFAHDVHVATPLIWSSDAYASCVHMMQTCDEA